MRADPRHHFVDLQGFGHVVDPAGRERGDLVFGLGQRSHEDHLDLARAGQRLQAAADFKAVQPRHHHVEQDQVRLHEVGPLQPFFAVLRDDHPIAAVLQAFDDHAQVGRGVIHDQDLVGDYCGCQVRGHGAGLRSMCCSTRLRIAFDW